MHGYDTGVRVPRRRITVPSVDLTIHHSNNYTANRTPTTTRSPPKNDHECTELSIEPCCPITLGACPSFRACADCAARPQSARHMYRTHHIAKLNMRWHPKTRYCREKRMPARKETTRTALGHSAHATVRRKSVRHVAETSRHTAGMRQYKQKKI